MAEAPFSSTMVKVDVGLEIGGSMSLFVGVESLKGRDGEEGAGCTCADAVEELVHMDACSLGDFGDDVGLEGLEEAESTGDVDESVGTNASLLKDLGDGTGVERLED